MNRVETKAKTLLKLRQKHLEARKVASIAESLGSLSEQWLSARSVYRRQAHSRLVRVSGFSAGMAEAMLDTIFSELTRKKLKKLLISEIGNFRMLDGFCHDWVTGKKRRALGPAMITHVLSANLPNPAINSLVHGMLVKSVNIIKASSSDPGIVFDYLESLKNHDKKLYSSNYLADPMNRDALADWIKASNLVVVYGSDEAIGQIRKKTDSRKDFVAYGHRTSFSIYLKEALQMKSIFSLAKKTAEDIWMADQRGCLSPSVVYVQKGGQVSGCDFAAKVAESLRELADKNIFSFQSSRSRILAKENLKQRWKIKKIALARANFWESKQPGEWAVFYDEERSDFPLTCGAQTIFVKGFDDEQPILKQICPIQKYLQAVALETGGAPREKMAAVLSAMGVNRITRAGLLQRPLATWRHDGRPNFSTWLRWAELE